MKTRLIVTIFLVVVLGGLVAVYYLLGGSQQLGQENGLEDAKTVTLYAVESAEPNNSVVWVGNDSVKGGPP